MIAFLLTPVGRWLAGAMVIVALIGGIYEYGKQRGKAGAIAKIEQANKSSGKEADTASDRVMSCPPGLWDKDRGLCATKLK